MKTYTISEEFGELILEDGVAISTTKILDRLNRAEKITESASNLIELLKIRDSDVLKNKKRFDRILNVEIFFVEKSLEY